MTWGWEEVVVEDASVIIVVCQVEIIDCVVSPVLFFMSVVDVSEDIWTSFSKGAALAMYVRGCCAAVFTCEH